MGLSLLHELHQAIIERIKDITRGDWKVLVLDENTKKIIDSVVKQDDILNHNIAQIERIEDRREPNPEMDAIYILAPEPYVVDCLLADFERRRYRQAFLVWTSVIDPQLRRRIDGAPEARQIIASFETMPIDFYPRESHLVTFKDPWSFPILYHPACNHLVRAHMQSLAQKITGLCILLGEYPKVRYYRPRNPLHEASVLCSHLARFIQEELDEYKQWNPNFPPQTSRPQGTLLVTDRSMDLMAPLVHEFTYQAMAHDLLDIKEGDKTTYHMVVNPGTSMTEEKDMELSEKDKVWTENRHRHMKDTIDKLMGDFQKFINENPHFTNENSDTTSLNAIRDMLAGLPQFQEMKEAYSLHLSMAQECMNAFQARKLPDIASVEQTLATGLDENFRKPKNTLDDVVPLLDDPAVPPQDRLRLIMIWLLWRDGVIPEDIKRLLAHAGLPPQEMETVTNLDLLGARTTHGLKETRVVPPPLFPKNTKNAQVSEEYALSRFEPVLKSALEEVCRGTLDQTLFPYVRPPADPNEELLAAQQGSLRAGRAPRWAQQGRRAAGQNNQRLLVFVAGGATYSEARACYEIGEANAREVVLATSHMLTPQFFLRQVGDLSVDKRMLDLPMERPKRSAPAHLFERPAPPQPAAQAPLPGVPQPRPQQSQQQQQQQFGARPGRAPPPGGLPSRPIPTTVPKLPTNEMSNLSLGSSDPPGSTGRKGEDGGADDKKPHKLEKKRRNFLGIKK